MPSHKVPHQLWLDYVSAALSPCQVLLLTASLFSHTHTHTHVKPSESKWTDQFPAADKGWPLPLLERWLLYILSLFVTTGPQVAPYIHRLALQKLNLSNTTLSTLYLIFCTCQKQCKINSIALLNSTLRSESPCTVSYPLGSSLLVKVKLNKQCKVSLRYPSLYLQRLVDRFPNRFLP